MPANDPITLLSLLKPRRREMARNLEFQSRDPQHFGTGATQADLDALDADILETSDPAEMARVNARQDAIAQAGTFHQPDVASMRHEVEGNALKRLILPVRERAAADAQLRDETFAQALLRDRLNNQDIAERQASTAAMSSARAAATRAGQTERQLMADRLMRARKLEEQANKRQGTGLMDFFTGRRDKQLAEAQALRGDIAPNSAQEIAAIAAQQFPGVSLDELIAQGVVSFDSPEELAELQAAFAQQE